MPAIVLSPIAWSVCRLALMLAVALYASRRSVSGPKDFVREGVLDGLDEGLSGHAHRAEAERAVHGAARLNRVFRLPRGPKIEFEAAGLGRLRLRRVG